MKDRMLYILLGIGAGIGVYYFLCKRKKEMSITDKNIEQKNEEQK